MRRVLRIDDELKRQRGLEDRQRDDRIARTPDLDII
jgi:hypothetical protein